MGIFPVFILCIYIYIFLSYSAYAGRNLPSLCPLQSDPEEKDFSLVISGKEYPGKVSQASGLCL